MSGAAMARRGARAGARRVMAAALLLGSVAAPVWAQPARSAVVPAVALAGVVRADDESPLYGALVTVRPRPGGASVAAGRAATTADGGAFRVEGLAVGWVDVVVRRLGFRPETLAVELPQPPGGPIVVPLQRLSQVLRPVVVRAAVGRGAFAAFEHRRAAGFGRFVTRGDIERRRPQRTTDLLRTVPGLSLERDESGGLAPRFRNATRGVSTARCDPSYWLDGTPLGPSLDLDALNPGAIEGIELYSGIATVPAALRGPLATGTCGVIAIWTRHGEPRPRAAASVAADSLAALAAGARLFTADQVDVAAQPLPRGIEAPSYPDSLRAAHVRGRVVLEFVVGTDGRVDDETIGVVSATHAAFAAAARESIGGARFTPALRGGRAVRQVVHLPVVFDPEAPAIAPGPSAAAPPRAAAPPPAPAPPPR